VRTHGWAILGTPLFGGWPIAATPLAIRVPLASHQP
jgi:hypothetical protein